MNDKINFKNPEYFENRELSWLKFNIRILNEAKDKSLPLLERMKFLAITASNLDEFFMVRVASLKDMVHAEYSKPDLAGLTPEEQLKEINAVAKKFVSAQYSTYNRSLHPLLNDASVQLIDAYEDLDSDQSDYVDKFFEEIGRAHV